MIDRRTRPTGRPSRARTVPSWPRGTHRSSRTRRWSASRRHSRATRGASRRRLRGGPSRCHGSPSWPASCAGGGLVDEGRRRFAAALRVADAVLGEVEARGADSAARAGQGGRSRASRAEGDVERYESQLADLQVRQRRGRLDSTATSARCAPWRSSWSPGAPRTCWRGSRARPAASGREQLRGPGSGSRPISAPSSP